MDDERSTLRIRLTEILVEKPVGLQESVLAAAISSVPACVRSASRISVWHQRWYAPYAIAARTGCDMPDTAFIPWTIIPGKRHIRVEAIPTIAADLAVEVLSASQNRPREMDERRAANTSSRRLA